MERQVNGTIVIIPAEGDIETHTGLKSPPTLETLQHNVGGWLELLPRWSKYDGNKAIAFCDEEGLLKNLPVNKRATEMWKAQFASAVALRGTVIVLSGVHEFMSEL